MKEPNATWANKSMDIEEYNDLYDAKRQRYLLRTGESVWTKFRAARYLYNHGSLPENTKVESCDCSFRYDFLNNTKHRLVHHEPLEPTGESRFTNDATDIIDRINDSLRLRAYLETPEEDKALKRIERELDFFEQNNYIPFLQQVVELIDRFKEDGVVWGVGRGSSCASFILYLLEIHDIDPLYYEIDFREFSKED